jgi:hypothetical protein
LGAPSDQEGFISPIESTIMANSECLGLTSSIMVAVADEVTVIVSVVVTFIVVDDVMSVVDVVAVVPNVTVFAPEAASAFLVLSVASIRVTTGGVTTANRPHCSKKARRSALICASFGSSLATELPHQRTHESEA